MKIDNLSSVEWGKSSTDNLHFKLKKKSMWNISVVLLKNNPDFKSMIKQYASKGTITMVTPVGINSLIWSSSPWLNRNKSTHSIIC